MVKALWHDTENLNVREKNEQREEGDSKVRERVEEKSECGEREERRKEGEESEWRRDGRVGDTSLLCCFNEVLLSAAESREHLLFVCVVLVEDHR